MPPAGAPFGVPGKTAFKGPRGPQEFSPVQSPLKAPEPVTSGGLSLPFENPQGVSSLLAGGASKTLTGLVFHTGFEDLVLPSTAEDWVVLLDNAGGRLTIDKTVSHSGGASLHWDITDGSNNALYWVGAAGNPQTKTFVGYLYMPLDLVTANTLDNAQIVLTIYDSAASKFLAVRVEYQGGDAYLRVMFNDFNAPVTNVWSSRFKIKLGGWYRVEFKLDSSAAGHKVTWGAAEGDGPLTIVDTDFTGGNTFAAVDYVYLRVGSANLAQDWKGNWDDIAVSSALADFPIGPIGHTTIVPDGDGTHNLDNSPSSYFTRNDGRQRYISLGDTDTYQVIDEIPVDTPTVEYLRIADGASFTNWYLEHLFQPAPMATGILGLRPIHALRNDNDASANSITSRISADNFAHSTDLYLAFSVASLSLVYKGSVVLATAPGGAAWTKALVGAVKERWGYTNNDAGGIRLEGSMIEVMYSLAPGTPAEALQGVASPGPGGAFGYTKAGAFTNTPGGNSKEAHGPYVMPTLGYVTKLRVYLHDDGGGSRNVRALIYADSDGLPGALVAQGPVTGLNATTDGSGWYDMPFSAPVLLQPGKYHIGMLCDVAAGQWSEIYHVAAAGDWPYHWNNDTFSDGATDPFGATPSLVNWRASIYALYVPVDYPDPTLDWFTAAPVVDAFGATNNPLPAPWGASLMTDSSAGTNKLQSGGGTMFAVGGGYGSQTREVVLTPPFEIEYERRDGTSDNFLYFCVQPGTQGGAGLLDAFVFHEAGAANGFNMERWDNGVYATTGLIPITTAGTNDKRDKWGVRVYGDGRIEVYWNGVLVGSCFDQTYTSGYFGFLTNGASGGGIDNVKAGLWIPGGEIIDIPGGVSQTGLGGQDEPGGVATTSLMPIEAQQAAGTPVSNTALLPLEELGGIAQTGSDPVEELKGVATTELGPLDEPGGITQTGSDPLEETGGVATTAAENLDETKAITQAGLEPLEDQQNVASTAASEPIEEQQGVTVTGNADPVEEPGGVANTNVENLDEVKAILQTGSEPTEEQQNVAATTASEPIEGQQGITATGAADPVEEPGGVANTGSDPLDEPGGVAQSGTSTLDEVRPATTTAQDPLESLQGITATGSADPVEEPQGVSTTDLQPLDEPGGVSNTGSEPVEELGGVAQPGTSTLDEVQPASTTALDPVESAKGISQTGSEVAEEPQGVTQTAGPDPVEEPGGVSASASEPLDEPGGVSQTGTSTIDEVRPATQTGSDPLESQQPVTQTGNADPVEEPQGVTATGGTDPVDEPGGVSQSGSDPLDEPGGVSATGSDPVEEPGGVASLAADPLDEQQQVTQSGSEPLEELRGVTATGNAEPVEALQGVASTDQMPVDEAQGTGAVTQTASLPIEELGGVATSGDENVETVRPVAQSSGTLPVEALQGIAQAAAAAIEALQGVATTDQMPVEEQTPAVAVSQTASMPVEELQGIAAPAGAPLEEQAAVTAAGGEPVEELASVAAAWAGPLESQLQVTLVWQGSLEALGGVAQAGPLPADLLAQVLALAGMPIEEEAPPSTSASYTAQDGVVTVYAAADQVVAVYVASDSSVTVYTLSDRTL